MTSTSILDYLAHHCSGDDKMIVTRKTNWSILGAQPLMVIDSLKNKLKLYLDFESKTNQTVIFNVELIYTFECDQGLAVD